jgi:hypothetical protein
VSMPLSVSMRMGSQHKEVSEREYWVEAIGRRGLHVHTRSAICAVDFGHRQQATSTLRGNQQLCEDMLIMRTRGVTYRDGVG